MLRRMTLGILISACGALPARGVDNTGDFTFTTTFNPAPAAVTTPDGSTLTFSPINSATKQATCAGTGLKSTIVNFAQVLLTVPKAAPMANQETAVNVSIPFFITVTDLPSSRSGDNQMHPVTLNVTGSIIRNSSGSLATWLKVRVTSTMSAAVIPLNPPGVKYTFDVSPFYRNVAPGSDLDLPSDDASAETATTWTFRTALRAKVSSEPINYGVGDGDRKDKPKDGAKPDEK